MQAGKRVLEYRCVRHATCKPELVISEPEISSVANLFRNVSCDDTSSELGNVKQAGIGAIFVAVDAQTVM